jgi:hypothetical protein
MTKEICVYCGEFPGSVFIQDPNGSLEDWFVCPTCKKIIEQQQKLSMAHILLDMEKRLGVKTGVPEEGIREATEEIERLSRESGLETFSAVIKRKDDNEEVEE